MPPTITDVFVRGASRIRSSVTLDNINLSNAYTGNSNRPGFGSIPLSGNRSATYEAMYRQNPWIRAAVDRVSGGIGRIPWDAYIDADEPGEREKQREGQLAELLANPYEDGTPSVIKQAIVKNLLIHENAVLVKVRPGVGRPPVEMLPSSFGYWEIVPGERRRIDWYIFHGELAGRPQHIPFRPEEVIHFHTWGTGRGLLGDSRMEALRQTLQIDDAVRRTMIGGFENGLRIVGAYSIDGILKDKAAAERMRAQLNETYGGVDNAFKIMLLEGGAKWQEMSHSLVDSDAVKLKGLTKEEVAAVMNVPQPSIGILDHATFSNVTEQHLMEYQDTYQPWTVLIEETLQEQLIEDEPTMAGQYVEFNYKQILKGDPIKEIEAGVKAVGGPYMTANEFRGTQNMPPIAGGDVLNAPPNAAGAPAQGAA